jgi:hypothetical protein
LRELCKRAGAALLWPVPLTLAGALVLALGLLPLGSGHVSRAVAEPGFQEAEPYTDAGVPAKEVVMIGATPAEPNAPGSEETWGLGQLKEGGGVQPKLVRYYVHPSETEGGEEGTWAPGPPLPEGFAPDTPQGKPSPLAGQLTPDGFGVLVGTITHEKETQQVLLVRNPGEAEGAFEPTAPVPAKGEVKAGEEPLLHEGQVLFGKQRAPVIAPLAETDGSAGALLVPVYEGAGVDEAVLHWDGHTWTREPIKIPAASAGEFSVLGLAASGPGDAWLIARLSSSYGPGAVALFHRVKEAEGWSWQPVEVEVGPGQVQLPLAVPVAGGAPASGEPLGVSGAAVSTVAVETQVLTVTSAGLWVDGVRTDVERQSPFVTMYVKPEGSKAAIARSWCNAPQGSPACQATLPQEPPQQYGRSIAWAGSQPFGERVITGLPEGVSLRLEGERFVPVLALGGGESASTIPGAQFGAAFSSPTEGWLGNGSIPVHLTFSSRADRLRNWPVATRHPLYAIAPQPGAAVGALSSEALAVGGDGAVARYRPGQGWLPETLFGPGERVEAPRLRAVAWPAPNRAYAVGEGGEMWLWRGETGLWERDPGTPINFRDNLDGVAFDPSNPARGYAVGPLAVGRGSVILRYGKGWTEETALPEAVKDAYFTGIAFAGSEAIVPYRVQPNLAVNAYVGGLLVNNGSGWTVDQEEQQVSGGAPPISVAGLPDGGAAVLAGDEGADYVYERQNGASPWQRDPIPVPFELAGALSLFRQGGALRAVVVGGGAGVGAEALRIESAPGFPPLEQPSSSITSGPEAGSLLRQTAAGWRDERHSVNTVEQGQFYGEYDMPGRPDPLFATLIGPEGDEGWAVGGIASSNANEETAGIERYPAEGQPPNEGTSTVPVMPEEAKAGAGSGVATLAFGGQAQCESPCADRIKTGIGPQVWLSSAVSLAKRIGAAAFFYTGPMVHPSPWQGRVPPPLPFESEYARYAGILGAGSPWPAYAANAEGELGGEAAEASEFAGLAAPLGGGESAGWQPASSSPSVAERASCGCEGAYYAIQNAHVEVIVLDDSGANGSVEAAQRVWLEQQLQQAGAVLRKPVLVVANADLSQQLSAGRHEEAAEQLFAALAGQNPDGPDTGHYAASAYFYDAPETNVRKSFTFHGATLAMFGSGTLGYELEQNEASSEFHGAKGILLGEVLWGQGTAAERAADVAPVRVRLIPVLGELAVEAKDGTLLPRSRAALFRGLARRPRAGCRAPSSQDQCEEGQYIPIPAICVGTTCQAEAVLPEYEFASSAPDIGAFVKLNTASNDPRSVLQNEKGEPVPDGHENAGGEQVGATSGLFCAYNKGITDVSIRAGGLSYTIPVTVQAGSVREPCGTVPLKHLTAASQSSAAPVPPPPAPAPAPTGPAPASSPPLVPVPPPPPAIIPPTPARQTPRIPPTQFFIQPALPFVTPAFVPAPPPAPAEPTPPSGTSAVTSPVEAAQKEEEEEEAPDTVSNKALAYSVPEHEPSPVYILGIVLLAAFAGASTVRRRPRRGRREVHVAPATLSSQRAQRRMGGGERRRW